MMKFLSLTLATAACLAACQSSLAQDDPPPFEGPGLGPRGPSGFGGPGIREDLELVKKFDKDNNGWLNAKERQAARKTLQDGSSPSNQRPGRPGGRGGPRQPFGGAETGEPPKPGERVSPADVPAFPNEPLYSSNVVRTIFLEFEAADWEKELESFHNTDVEVPAKLTMDGKSYPEVGVRFRGNTSYMMVGTGRKRPLNLSLDMAHPNQNLMGFRTLNLLNAHEDPSFLRTVLAMEIARAYIPAPRANFVRLVVNGESWGVYINVEQFNKDFLLDRFGTTKGARWKVPGNPGGRGGLEYLGEDVTKYRAIYQIKSKDEPKAWNNLVRLCKILGETPANELPATLESVLDVDATLRFLAWDNVLAGGDGFWTRASDYNMYEDLQGRFHFIPYDVNETFSTGGGPGAMRGPGSPGGFGAGNFLAPAFLDMGDRNGDSRLSAAEFEQLANAWFAEMDVEKKGTMSKDEFVDGLNALFPPPGGPGGFGPPLGGNDRRERGGRRRFGPGMFLGEPLFTSADANKDASLTAKELQQLFAGWYKDWKTDAEDGLNEENVRNGLSKSLPAPAFGGPEGQMGGRRGPGGVGGPGGPGSPGGFAGPRGGSTLDPLVAAKDPAKALISKLLAVPEYRTRYLGYVRDIAEVWLDWSRLGAVAQRYHDLIAPQVKADTRKLNTYEEFASSVSSGTKDRTDNRDRSIQSFAEQRRNYLLNHADVKAAKPVSPK